MALLTDESKFYTQAWISRSLEHLNSRSAYLIACWTSLLGCLRSTINLTCPRFNSYPSLFSISVKGITTQAVVHVRNLGVVLGCFSTLPTKSSQSPGPADFLNLFFFVLICNIHTEKSLSCASFFDVIITKHNLCNQRSGHQIDDCQGSRKPSLSTLLVLKSNLSWILW